MKIHPNPIKYEYTPKCREISGFGGDYEQACRNMVIRGMEWFDENPKSKPEFKQYNNVYGIISEENSEAESLTNSMDKVVDGASGAMMQASINHVMFAIKNGWLIYIKEMETEK